MKMKINIKYK